MIKHRCPNCGFKHHDTGYAEELLDITLQNTPRRILTRLMLGNGATVSKAVIVEELYGDRPDGGPDTAEKVVESHISKLRKRIKPRGWTIRCSKFDGYRLVRVSQ